MSLGALAGAIGGAGEATHRNRERRRADETFNIMREEADRETDRYNRQTAYREAMETYPDPRDSQQPPSVSEQAGPENQPIIGQGGLPGADAAPAGDTLGVLGMGSPSPAPQAAPQAAPQKYRDRLREWERNVEHLAMRAGGLEEVAKMREMGVTLAKQNVLGYGIEAARALHDNRAGDAAKLANTALDVTPVDTGLKFFTKNGKVYLEGETGDVSGPYDGDQLQEMVTDFMQTPENFLEVRGQRETERAAKATEDLREGELKVAEDAEARLKKYAERSMQAEEGRTLSALITAKAADKRAMSAIERALLNNGWELDDIIRVMNLTEDFTLDNFKELSPKVKFYYDAHPKALSDLKSDISYLQLENKGGVLDPNKAAMISQLIRQPGGIDAEQVGADLAIIPKANGRLAGVLDGREFWLTPELQDVYFKRVPEAKKALEDMQRGTRPPTEDEAAQSEWEAMIERDEVIPTG